MNVDRRRFITWTTGGALLLALGDVAIAEAEGADGLSPWFRLDPNGDVTIFTTVSDMGQGARTGQAQVLADELEVPWERVKAEIGQDRDPFRRNGSLQTGGSRSIRNRFDILRKAGATARAQLIAAAAARWGVKPEDCKAEQGFVSHLESRKRLSYGELAADAAKIAPPANPTLKTPAQWRYIGKPLPIPETPDRVNGKLKYGIDVKLPGMLYATIRQSPVYGGTLASVDEAPAMAIPGVKKVVRLPNAVVVVADKTWTAFKACRALDPKWTDPVEKLGSKDVEARLAAAFDDPKAEVVPQTGAAARTQLRAAYAAATRKLEATYDVAHLYHAPIEPMNTTARVTADKIELWSPTQVVTPTRRNVGKALGRPLEDVDLHVTRIGGGFGRRLQTDYAVYAALTARELPGVPVQLLWTREEDIAHDAYRSRGKLSMRAAIDADGGISGYEIVGAVTNDTFNGGADPGAYDRIKTWASTQTAVQTLIPMGAWRSVDDNPCCFVRESFIDECAHLVGADPLEYRRRLLAGNARGLKALNTVAGKIGWGSPKAPGVGRGLALLSGWNTIVAHAIEVKVDADKLRVTRIVVAADPGVVVNPQQVQAMAEGGTLMGLSAALGEEMTFTDGRADQQQLNAYPLLRMRQAPPLEAIVLSTPEAGAGGMGEPPVPGVAPALANAIFDATGKRIRALPFKAAGFKI